MSNFEYSGVTRRISAYVIDLMILSVITKLITMADVGSLLFIESSQHARLLGTLIAGSIPWLYFCSFESSDFQATPGKQIVGIRIEKNDNEKVTLRTSIGRLFFPIFIWAAIIGIPLWISTITFLSGVKLEINNSLVLLASYPLFGALYLPVSLIFIFRTETNQAPHDLAFNTAVIRRIPNTNWVYNSPFFCALFLASLISLSAYLAFSENNSFQQGSNETLLGLFFWIGLPTFSLIYGIKYSRRIHFYLRRQRSKLPAYLKNHPSEKILLRLWLSIIILGGIAGGIGGINHSLIERHISERTASAQLDATIRSSNMAQKFKNHYESSPYDRAAWIMLSYSERRHVIEKNFPSLDLLPVDQAVAKAEIKAKWEAVAKIVATTLGIPVFCWLLYWLSIPTYILFKRTALFIEHAFTKYAQWLTH